MTKAFCILLLSLATSLRALAADPVQDVAAERARIASERNRAEAVFQAEQKACYGRFAVAGCIEEAKVRRREVLADLRRQEIALNDAERKARSADRMRQLEQKQSEEARRQADAAASGQARRASREQRAQDKAVKAEAAAAKEGTGTPRAPRPARQAKAGAARAHEPTQQPDTEDSRRKYDERQRQAQEHKATVQEREAGRKKQSQPLPVPP